MADEIVGQEYPAKGTTYVIPKLENVADAVVAFTEYSDSIPFSEYIVTETVTADTGVDNSYNGKMIVAQADVTLTFGNLENGFSVACVADGEYTISYEGVDKENQQTQAYEVATVVTVNDRNILSVARAESDSIIIDQGPAEGTPPAPILVDKDGNEDANGGSVIYFTPGVPDAEQAPAIFHSAKIRRQDNADLTTETVTVDQDNMEIAVTGTTAFVYYVVDVYGINEEGKGETASTSAFQLNYNEATGGEEKIVENYNGTSEKWKVHTFTPTTPDKSITIVSAPGSYPFRVLAIAGGGGNGRDSNDSAANGPGDAGEIFQSDDMDLSAITYDFVIGTGGAARSNSASSGVGNPGNLTTAFGNTLNGGGSSGPGTTYRYGKGVEGVGQDNKDQGYGKGHDSNITGLDAFYGYGGKGYPNIANWTPQWQQMGPGAGGTVWEDLDGQPATSSRDGIDGVVIVAYQIGTSTTREIQQAQAEEAARQAGVEQGIQQGYSQAQQDLQEELTSLRTQLSAVGTSDV